MRKIYRCAGWRDEIVITDRMNWMRRVQQRIEWNALGETFIWQWTENGRGRRRRRKTYFTVDYFCQQ
jgi:hypothetical protein